MDLTADLVQCVNNDIKESLLDSPLHTPMREEVDLESEADIAAADKYFKGENNYVENFDYCDETSFDDISLSGSDENEPFKCLDNEADVEIKFHDIDYKEDDEVTLKFCYTFPNSQDGRRRVRKKLGFSKGYYSKAASKIKMARTRAILRWLKSIEKSRKCAAKKNIDEDNDGIDCLDEN